MRCASCRDLLCSDDSREMVSVLTGQWERERECPPNEISENILYVVSLSMLCSRNETSEGRKKEEEGKKGNKLLLRQVSIEA